MNDDKFNKIIKGVEDKNNDIKKGSLGNITYPDKPREQKPEATSQSENQDSISKDEK